MYEPLDDSRRQIRLLHLHRGDDDVKLACTFSLVSLDDDPHYEAVSYVWGDFNKCCSIDVGAVNEPVPIMRNLHSVLRNLRLHDRQRILWVDALCINQNDLVERGKQVAMMATVFSRASRVLAYLGDHWDRCELAVEAIRQLREDESMHLFSYMQPGLSINGVGLESLELFNTVIAFLNSDWMTRIWTVQEFVVAKEVVFLYG
ncbi:uncharacterized protein K460DRAFT_313916, partial [Cucurbitaria berberidis CBS 394.84]